MTHLRQRLNALNVWQRSWCVLALTWLAACAAITIYSVPTEEAFRADALAYAADLRSDIAKIDAANERCDDKLSSEGLTPTAECLQRVERQMGSTFVDQSAIAQIMTNLETDAHEQAIQARLSAAEKGIAVWIVPSIGLYLLGMGVSWIRRAAGQ